MAWIEFHQELRDHPKLRRLAALLGVSAPAAVGHLAWLWWWALDHAEDGDLADYDEVDLALASGWPGDPQAFVDALVECGPGRRPGFVDRDGDHLALHDWVDYFGPLRARRRAASKANHARWHKARGDVVEGCAWCETDPIGVRWESDRSPKVIRADSTEPNQTKPNQDLPRGAVDNAVDNARARRDPVVGSQAFQDRQRERERYADEVLGGGR